jgi:hypothetical protein
LTWLANAIPPSSKYPGGIHVGLDLNYIQPELSVTPSPSRQIIVLTCPSIPANMRFLQKDIEDRWQDLEPGSWDLIHMRALYGSISNWPRVYAEIYR